jgi:hypothetical protein
MRVIWGRLFWLAALVVSLSGCISAQSYIDTALPVLRNEDLQQVAAPQPVQLLYEFRTKGAPNARATQFTKPHVVETVSKSGLFSQVQETPVTGGRVLTIVIDNVSLTDDAAAKGFGVGLTFGLAGTMVTDGYICTATYAGPGVTASPKTVKHALHTTIGNASGPPGVPPMKAAEAVPQVMRQLTLNALQAIRRDGL